MGIFNVIEVQLLTCNVMQGNRWKYLGLGYLGTEVVGGESPCDQQRWCLRLWCFRAWAGLMLTAPCSEGGGISPHSLVFAVTALLEMVYIPLQGLTQLDSWQFLVCSSASWPLRRTSFGGAFLLDQFSAPPNVQAHVLPGASLCFGLNSFRINLSWCMCVVGFAHGVTGLRISCSGSKIGTGPAPSLRLLQGTSSH